MLADVGRIRTPATLFFKNQNIRGREYKERDPDVMMKNELTLFQRISPTCLLA